MGTAVIGAPEFRARNGIVVRPNANGGIEAGKPGYRDYTPPEATFALEEFFQAKRDEELGRWRWPENPDYVVYRDTSGDAIVFREQMPVGGILYRRGDDVVDMESEAARAYFEAHPERKPWEAAREGELWNLDGEQYLCIIDTDGETVIGPRFFPLPLVMPSDKRWQPARFPHEFTTGTRAWSPEDVKR